MNQKQRSKELFFRGSHGRRGMKLFHPYGRRRCLLVTTHLRLATLHLWHASSQFLMSLAHLAIVH